MFHKHQTAPRLPCRSHLAHLSSYSASLGGLIHLLSALVPALFFFLRFSLFIFNDFLIFLLAFSSFFRALLHFVGFLMAHTLLDHKMVQAMRTFTHIHMYMDSIMNAWVCGCACVWCSAALLINNWFVRFDMWRYVLCMCMIADITVPIKRAFAIFCFTFH